VVGDIAIGLILFIGVGGMLRMGVLRALNARERGNSIEAKGRFIFISSIFAGVVVMLIGAADGSPTIGEIGVFVLLIGAVVGMTLVVRGGVSK
jgi:hypothetical protein